MTVDEAHEALRAKYRSPAWAYFAEVPSATASMGRIADGLAFNLWPSQGLELHGFEIKAFRGDWLRELKNPIKAEESPLAYCDRVFVVALVKEIVKPDELPPGWGLMEPHGQFLRVVQKAEKNGAAHPLDRLFIASIMRQAGRYIELTLANADVTQQHYRRGFDEGKRSGELEVVRLREDSKVLADAVQRFQDASGVEIDSWVAGDIGRAVRLVRKHGILELRARLLALQRDLNGAINGLVDPSEQPQQVVGDSVE